MNPILQLNQLQKSYGSYEATRNLSMSLQGGSIFGLLGPNGAGKTTLIRMITRIIFPDSGSILFKGKPMEEQHVHQIGYMPEERGLYKKMKVREHLVYLGRLKGLTSKQATEKINYWFKKFEIENWGNKKIEELSKGMSQKVQFIGTVLHEPDLLILDEPFSGLDPINSMLIEQEIRQFKEQGKAILFSTHRMEQVEGICDTIALINKGENILCGEVKALKQQFKENKFEVGFEGKLPEHFQQHFKVLSQRENHAVISNENNTSNEVLKYFIEQKVTVNSFRELLPTINEIFIKNVENAAAL